MKASLRFARPGSGSRRPLSAPADRARAPADSAERSGVPALGTQYTGSTMSAIMSAIMFAIMSATTGS